jgi:hypothetical protein
MGSWGWEGIDQGGLERHVQGKDIWLYLLTLLILLGGIGVLVLVLTLWGP